MNPRAALVAVAFSLLPVGAVAGEVPPGTALFFGLHLIDTSTEGAINGVRADETARLAMIETQIADDLTDRGFALTRPQPDQVAAIKDPSDCNGCDTRLAADLGLDYAISGQVQKVSNLILSMNLYIRDAESGENVRAGAVDIRGNNDDSFRRGYSYLLRNIIFREK